MSKYLCITTLKSERLVSLAELVCLYHISILKWLFTRTQNQELEDRGPQTMFYLLVCFGVTGPR